jgi:hypothetical protein
MVDDILKAVISTMIFKIGCCLDPTSPKPQDISPEERERRIAEVNYGRGTVRLEGFTLSPESEAIYQLYIDGELTSEEVSAAIHAMYVSEDRT